MEHLAVSATMNQNRDSQVRACGTFPSFSMTGYAILLI